MEFGHMSLLKEPQHFFLMSYTPPEYLIWKLSQLAFNITWLKNHFREQSFSENVSKLLPRDFDTWNTREKNLSQSPRKAFQERLMFVYLVFTCYWRQICYTQLSKPSPILRSWAPLIVYDATVSTRWGDLATYFKKCVKTQL